MTMIITGANHGLGYETARVLAVDTNQSLVMAGRDLPDLIRASRDIQAETGNIQLLPTHLDLASLDSVRSFVDEFHSQKLPPLRVIICNAGVSKSTVQERSIDGYEVTFAVNHLGHFLLVNLLLDRLQPPARILFVSSGAHDSANANGPMQPPRYIKAEWLAYPERDPDILTNDDLAGGQAYASSKLCNVLCTYEMARRLEAAGLNTPARPITVNAFDPGFMPGTELARGSRGLTRFAWYHVLPRISRIIRFVRTTERSGTDLAYLATAPELTGVTSKYYSGREMIASSVESYDLNKATDLWQISVELSRLKSDESPLVR